MTAEDIHKALLQAAQTVFNVSSDPDLARLVRSADFAFADLTDSSLGLTQLSMELEDLTGIEIELADLLDHPTARAFCDNLAAKVARG